MREARPEVIKETYEKPEVKKEGQLFIPQDAIQI